MKKTPSPLFPSSLDQQSVYNALSVSQLTLMIKDSLKKTFPSSIKVAGEISNFTMHRSGHCYLTLKDAGSELSCVMWKSVAAKLKFKPQDGLLVVAHGQIDLYEKGGRYQLQVRQLIPTGSGAWEVAFRQLYERLKREGLFEPTRKKPIPRFPRHIILVTSPSGAAVRDLLQTLQRRYPCLRVSLYPVAVQGQTAGSEIAHAIEQLNRHQHSLGGIDTIIVGRGGGSIEDLWAFNEERVVRAIYHSQISIISAVGHETDVTLSDLVADLRAATPTAAAELATPVRTELLQQLMTTQHRLTQLAYQQLKINQQMVTALQRREPLRSPTRPLQQHAQRLDHLQTRLDHGWVNLLQRRHHHLVQSEKFLRVIEPTSQVSRLTEKISSFSHQMHAFFVRQIHDRRLQLLRGWQRLQEAGPKMKLSLSRQQMEMTRQLLSKVMQDRFKKLAEYLEAQEQLLGSMDYHKTLARGYTVTREATSAKLIARASDAVTGQVVLTETSQGQFESVVQ